MTKPTQATLICVVRPTQIVFEITGYLDRHSDYHPVGKPLPTDGQPYRVVYDNRSVTDGH